MWENFYEKISNIINDGKKIAIATVVKTCGSSPASSGQQIAVSDDKTCFATVGGGASEAKVIEKCLQMIKDGSKVEQFFIDHNIEGMSCGGSMSLFINVIGNDNNLFIFGGGHIAQSLSKIAKSCDFNVNVIEDRGDFEQYFEDVNFNIMNTDEYRENIKLEDSSYVVICTRGHKEDEKALEFALTQNPKYIGMIGSKKKVIKIMQRLREKGFEQHHLDRVNAPIGLDIASEKPAEIAISIMAEILLIKNEGTLRHKKGEK